MENILLFITIISILFLLGFVFYFFLSKIPKKGKTKVRWKIALYKFLQIEFESEHNSNTKK
ncbi:MAG: hypothetical protein K2N51_18915 [Lachnospiraceae bacterium]|nr:hypothetical protein [Lachnospiraceae bacterium]